MEFDKSKVYTALNADELKVGSKIIGANSISWLKESVVLDEKIERLDEILSEDCPHRFKSKESGTFSFAYLVEPPEEKKLKWTDLKVGDVIRKNTYKFMVTGIDDDTEDATDKHIYIGSTGVGSWLSNDELKKWEKVE